MKFWQVNLFSGHEKDEMILDPVPPCFFSHLKTIEIDSYSGYKNELSAVKKLLKNAVGLGQHSYIFKPFCKGIREARSL